MMFKKKIINFHFFSLLHKKTSILFHWQYFPFLILFLLLLIAHFSINLEWGDDGVFAQFLTDGNIINFAAQRYETWSSRIIIEIILSFMAKNLILWRIMDSVVIVFSAFCISKLFTKERQETNWIIVIFFLLIPLNLDRWRPGYIASTLNYFWPLAFGLFSLFPIKKIITKQKIFWYEFPLYIIALLYAANQEQMCFILIACYGIFSIIEIIKFKRISIPVIIFNMLLLLSLIFILNCPGNYIRSLEQTVTSCKEFADFSFTRKIEIGYSTSLAEFIFKPNFIFTFFSALLLVAIINNKQNKLTQLIAAIPFTNNLIFGIFYNFSKNIFPSVEMIVANGTDQFGSGAIFFTSSLRVFLKTCLPDLILLIVVGAVIFSLFKLFPLKKFLFLFFIFLIGFISRFLIGFTPAICHIGLDYGWRTFLFFISSIIILSIIIYDTYFSGKNNIKGKFILIYIATFASFLVYIETLLGAWY